MRIRTITALAALVFLTACGTSKQAYTVTIDEAGAARADELFAAAMRMFERRVEAVGGQQGTADALKEITLDRNGNEATIRITLTSADLAAALADDLQQAFTFRLMEQVPVDEADIVVAETEGFRALPLTEEDVAWINVDASGESGNASVTFTSEGEQRKHELFAEHTGTYIGLFIRGMPVYKFLVEENDVNAPTLLMNIPNSELARVFADDVNVGLHTQITLQD